MKRISKMKVGERVKLAMLGNKEERAILIRRRARRTCHLCSGATTDLPAEVQP